MSSHDSIRQQLEAAQTAQQALYQLLDRLPEEHDTESLAYANYTRARSAASAVGEIVNDLSAAAAATG